jgi:hypothetical protein
MTGPRITTFRKNTAGVSPALLLCSSDYTGSNLRNLDEGCRGDVILDCASTLGHAASMPPRELVPYKKGRAQEATCGTWSVQAACYPLRTSVRPFWTPQLEAVGALAGKATYNCCAGCHLCLVAACPAAQQRVGYDPRHSFGHVGEHRPSRAAHQRVSPAEHKQILLT